MDKELLTPAEVAKFFRVDVKTVTRWAKEGKLNAYRTLGGHRRYSRQECEDLFNGVPVVIREKTPSLPMNSFYGSLDNNTK